MTSPCCDLKLVCFGHISYFIILLSRIRCIKLSLENRKKCLFNTDELYDTSLFTIYNAKGLGPRHSVYITCTKYETEFLTLYHTLLLGEPDIRILPWWPTLYKSLPWESCFCCIYCARYLIWATIWNSRPYFTSRRVKTINERGGLLEFPVNKIGKFQHTRHSIFSVVHNEVDGFQTFHNGVKRVSEIWLQMMGIRTSRTNDHSDQTQSGWSLHCRTPPNTAEH